MFNEQIIKQTVGLQGFRVDTITKAPNALIAEIRPDSRHRIRCGTSGHPVVHRGGGIGVGGHHHYGTQIVVLARKDTLSSPDWMIHCLTEEPETDKKKLAPHRKGGRFRRGEYATRSLFRPIR